MKISPLSEELLYEVAHLLVTKWGQLQNLSLEDQLDLWTSIQLRMERFMMMKMPPEVLLSALSLWIKTKVVFHFYH
jgi:hypothetical protein